ncbi:two-component sensor histidine kinase, partial [Staphylococcus felis]|nr:two-component sensor histidine kinase [Staphylococcus felis]
MKQSTLKTKWTLVTTIITFLIIFIFCLLIIYAISSLLKQNELTKAENSLDDVLNLLDTKPFNDISAIEYNSVTDSYQKVIIFNQNGHQLVENSNTTNIEYSPPFKKYHIRNIKIINSQNNSYVVVFSQVDTDYFSGYVVIVHSLDV